MTTRLPERLPRDPRRKLVAVILDPESIGRASRDAEHERAVAVYDLLDDNYFAVPRFGEGPFRLTVSIAENRLCFAVADQGGQEVVTHLLSLRPFRRIVKDYFMMCESYYAAIRTASAAQIEAIDMGRRGLHNEASELLIERLEGKVEVDFETARRLFTLIVALHWKG